jgi:hypothetical protein
MTRKLKPATDADANRINRALYDLRMVRDDLKRAGADQAVIAVRHAIKSTEGALRHVARRIGQPDSFSPLPAELPGAGETDHISIDMVLP